MLGFGPELEPLQRIGLTLEPATVPELGPVLKIAVAVVTVVAVAVAVVVVFGLGFGGALEPVHRVALE